MQWVPGNTGRTYFSEYKRILKIIWIENDFNYTEIKYPQQSDGNERGKNISTTIIIKKYKSIQT